jgi:NADH:ubiquinone oxidoreductase subunit 3 (subunit A)
MDVLLTPPLAFVVYLAAVGGLLLLGRRMAGASKPTPLKTSLYASGNVPKERSAPGYRTFFVIALFFAAFHLGALVLGSSDLSPTAAVYLVGLAVTLIALLLG